MSNSHRGWTATVDRLEKDNEYGQAKQYSVYTLTHEDGRQRWVFNWGKSTIERSGQWKPELSRKRVGEKLAEKQGKGYAFVWQRRPVKVTDALLANAGIELDYKIYNQSPPTPVVTSHLDKFVAELNRVAADVTEGVTPDVLVAYANLRTEMERLRSEVSDAEGRMDMLGALITHRFEESS